MFIVDGFSSLGSIGERSFCMKVSSIIPLLTGQSPPVLGPPPGKQQLKTCDRYGHLCSLPRVTNVDRDRYCDMEYLYSRICSKSMRLSRWNFSSFKFGRKMWLKSKVSKIFVPETGAWISFLI